MKYLSIFFFGAILFFASCSEDDYLIDGGISSANLNKTTYDFLSSNPLFDTLTLSIDKAGLKEVVNGDVTFFAVTNFSFKNYVDAMTTRGRAYYNNPNYVYAYDSIPVQILRDSLSMYIFPGKIQRKDLRKEGDLFTNIIGTQLRISLEPQEDYKEQLTNSPEYIYLTHKRGKYWDEWDAEISGNEKDAKERIQTSGLISTNGIIHVLANTHVLFYYKN
jgi:hypothetical protein